MKVLRRQSVMLKVRGVIQQSIEKARQEKKIGANSEHPTLCGRFVEAV
jgi:hypothetical protein